MWKSYVCMTGDEVEDDQVADPTLPKMIRAHRGQLSQKEFAKLVGLSDGMVGHLESGTRSMSVESVERVSEALNLDPSQRAELRAARDRQSVTRPGDDERRRVAELERRLNALGAAVLILLQDADEELLGGLDLDAIAGGP